MGSSLKLCLVAEGTAHIYPRLGPTMEWDTAAAHCIVEAAGGAAISGTCAGSDKECTVPNNTERTLEVIFIRSQIKYPWGIARRILFRT